MMNFGAFEWREKRNLLNKNVPFAPMHFNISNYSTDAGIECKTEMKSTFPTDEIFDRFRSIPDPLQKNLADTLITTDKKNNIMTVNYGQYNRKPEIVVENSSNVRQDSHPSLAGFTGFITNVFGAISNAMFNKRSKSPVSQYFDCYEESHEMAPDTVWHPARNDDQNKKATNPASTVPNDTMNNCKAAVSHCEDKLNAVRNLLATKSAPVAKPNKFRSRRPRKVFVEPGAVEESFEDAFTPEDFIPLANEDYIEYVSIHNNHTEGFKEAAAPKIKTESTKQSLEAPIVPSVSEMSKPVSEIDASKVETAKVGETEIIDSPDITVNSSLENKEVDDKEVKKEIISSCEDKMARLKLLLQDKCKKPKTNQNSTYFTSEPVKEDLRTQLKPPKPIPIDKSSDKRFKNPNRLCDKRKQLKLRKNIKEDMLFANEIDSEDLFSVENSPCFHRLPISLPKESSLPEESDCEYFDEVKGRFRTTSTTESEDSFQIVFTDSPTTSKMHRPSDCDSEDSFIIFEDSPDSCYTSNDVFGDNLTSEASDEESDFDGTDSGVGKLSHEYSRTVSNLTDDSLYEKKGDDVVDCAVRMCEEIPQEEIECEVSGIHGLLLNEKRKAERKGLPAKTVTFSSEPPKVRVLRVWAFAARQARAGHWERHALDRERFRRRIADADMALSWVLKPQHRSRVMFQRFMPWWNQQRRKEIAEKKQKEEEERLKKKEEEERLKKEAEEQRLIEVEKERLKKEAEEQRLKEAEEERLQKVEEDKVGEVVLVESVVADIKLLNEINDSIVGSNKVVNLQSNAGNKEISKSNVNEKIENVNTNKKVEKHNEINMNKSSPNSKKKIVCANKLVIVNDKLSKVTTPAKKINGIC